MRSFFGVLKVIETSDGRSGCSRTAPRCTAASASATSRANRYRAAAADDVLLRRLRDRADHRAARARQGGGPIRYAVIGLGTGTLACRVEPGDRRALLRDRSAMVRHRARSEPVHLPHGMRPDVPIMLGDARLTLADAPDGGYDVIVVDAFTSDAIPIHLMTREAMAIYHASSRRKASWLIHISNRHLELARWSPASRPRTIWSPASARAATSPRTTATTSSSAP